VIAQPVHPHLFRYRMLTYLTARGLSDSQIQLISDHETKRPHVAADMGIIPT
jgi:hypothetical protein